MPCLSEVALDGLYNRTLQAVFGFLLDSPARIVGELNAVFKFCGIVQVVYARACRQLWFGAG